MTTTNEDCTPFEKLTKRQRERWLAAKALFENIKSKAYAYNAEILYNNKIITPEQIDITGDESINICFGNTKINWFEVKKDWDHGLYTKKKDYEKEFRKSFKLVKTIEY